MSSASRFSRYAIYVIADPSQPLFERASRWLGWDCVAGRAVDHPRLNELANPTGLHIHEATTAPRKYGFHGTIKPPMKLAEGVDEARLMQRVSDLAASLPAARIEQLKLARLGKFLALIPAKPTLSLQTLASTWVAELDDLRHPLSEAELARRRQNGLSARQEKMLQRYGYPYVHDEFRFHLTLTGQLDSASADAAQAMLQEWIAPVLVQPFVIDRLAVVGEDRETGQFHFIDWVPFQTNQKEI